MKHIANKYYGIALLGILLYFSMNAMIGKVAFGHGLGDIVYIPALWGITLIYLIAFIKNRNKFQRLLLTNFLLTLPSIYIILSATIWRGVEYSWNGEIFYIPCRTEIQIENDKKSKMEIVTMCSMTYYSDFTGTWNGKEMEQINGEIKIPLKLKKHIDFPVEKIFIQPNHLNLIEKGIVTNINQFDLDMLKINRQYKLGGEICKIIDRKPMFEVRFKQ